MNCVFRSLLSNFAVRRALGFEWILDGLAHMAPADCKPQRQRAPPHHFMASWT